MPEPISAWNLSPSPPPPKKGKRLTGGALAALVATVVALTSSQLTEPSEGYSGKAYWDKYGKVWTQCFGETADVDPSVVYSEKECAVKLRARMAKDFTPALLKCVPDFAIPDYKFAFGALLDGAYNAGPAAACRSPMAREFNAGNWTLGCAKFQGWYETAKGVKVVGLVNRRRKELKFCMTGKTR